MVVVRKFIVDVLYRLHFVAFDIKNNDFSVLIEDGHKLGAELNVHYCRLENLCFV